MVSHARLRHQPFKAAFLIYEALGTLLIRIPYWALCSIHPACRPRRSWSAKRTMKVHLLRRLTALGHYVGPLTKQPDYRDIHHGEGVNGVWVEPIDPACIVGDVAHWAAVVNAEPIRLPGYWIHEEGSDIAVGGPPMKGEKVVYALHGGAYVTLSAHPSSPTSNIARSLIQHIDSVHRTFSIEYRLSSGPPYMPAHPFPTALLDALTGYDYLVNVIGFSPDDIIVEGDSAGGNLALALVRYLVENQHTRTASADCTGVPSPPGALILSSPWCDLGTSHDTLTSSSATCVNSDYIRTVGSGTDYPKAAFVGAHGMGAADTNRYISPASFHPGMPRKDRFKGFPRTFIVCGGAEALRDQIRALSQLMTEDMGEDAVRYHEDEDGIHDYLVFDFCDPERTETYKEIGEWVDEADRESVPLECRTFFLACDLSYSCLSLCCIPCSSDAQTFILLPDGRKDSRFLV